MNDAELSTPVPGVLTQRFMAELYIGPLHQVLTLQYTFTGATIKSVWGN